MAGSALHVHLAAAEGGSADDLDHLRSFGSLRADLSAQFGSLCWYAHWAELTHSLRTSWTNFLLPQQAPTCGGVQFTPLRFAVRVCIHAGTRAQARPGGTLPSEASLNISRVLQTVMRNCGAGLCTARSISGVLSHFRCPPCLDQWGATFVQEGAMGFGVFPARDTTLRCGAACGM